MDNILEQKAHYAHMMRYVKEDRDFRRALFSEDFTAFFIYYYGWDLTDWQEEWAWYLQYGENILFKAFRASRKTTMVRGWVVWNIAYALEPYIVWGSFEDTLSGESVRAIARMLLNKKLVEDYGQLFPFEVDKKELAKKSAYAFESTTGVRVESKALGQTMRGANAYDPDSEMSARPTVLILDDVDTSASVANPDIIEKNHRKITGEMFGALDPLHHRIIFMGNVINSDGVLPRFDKEFTGKPNWKIFTKAIYDETGACVWPEVFTPEVIEKVKSHGVIAFAQNYLLIPYSTGQKIIPQSAIRYSPTYPRLSRVTIGIDPAFSEKTDTDSMAVSVVAHVNIIRDGTIIGVHHYIIAVYEFEGQAKNEETFTAFIESLYHKVNCSLILIESNNGGEIIARMLQRKKLAVTVYTAIKDKVTRLREYEGKFTRGEVFFLPGTEKAEAQILQFPTKGVKDDMVDAVVYGIK